MTFRDHGYYGYAYLGSRILEILALLPVIGMVGNLLSVIAKSHDGPPPELLVAIITTCLALLWAGISVTAYDDTHIPYVVTLAVDILFLIPFLVITIAIGQPLSVTTCSDLPKEDGVVMMPLATYPNGHTSYIQLTGSGRTICHELMAVWGFMIALSVLFVTSAAAAGFLFLGKQRTSPCGGRPFRGYATNESQIEMAPPKPPYSRSPSPGPQKGPPAVPAEAFDDRYKRSTSPAADLDELAGTLRPPPRRPRDVEGRYVG